MMITKKITSIVFIIAIASMFVSSSVIVNSILAKTSTSSSKGNMGSAQQDYTSFQKCLSSAEGTKGFATQQEIKDCYNQIYNTSTASTSSTGTSNGQ